MPVTKIKSQKQYQDITASPEHSVIEFWAPWDAPSKELSPKFDTYAEKFKNIKFYRVDINDQVDVAMDSGVKLAPTFRFFKGGKQVGEYRGTSYPELERTIAAQAKA